MKVFYLLLYSISLRTLSLSPLKLVLQIIHVQIWESWVHNVRWHLRGYKTNCSYIGIWYELYSCRSLLHKPNLRKNHWKTTSNGITRALNFYIIMMPVEIVKKSFFLHQWSSTEKFWCYNLAKDRQNEFLIETSVLTVRTNGIVDWN